MADVLTERLFKKALASVKTRNASFGFQSLSASQKARLPGLIAEEIRTGKYPRKQAIAIAYSRARREG